MPDETPDLEEQPDAPVPAPPLEEPLAAEPAPEPVLLEPEPEPSLQVVYVPVRYEGMPDPETLEGRIWKRGRYQYMPQGMATRLVAADSRFRILSFPEPRTSDGGPILRTP